MKYSKISGIDSGVSQMALGTWPFSGNVWGSLAEKTCVQTINAALEAGINLIDTAPFYGMGRAEEIVGKAVKGKRDRVVIATKCGLIQEGKSIQINLKPSSIRQELELSLKRLDTDVIDLYQTHWPDSETSIEDTLKEMKKFVEEGKVKAIGICNADLSLLKKAASACPLASVQNEYSLLKREAEQEILPFCEKEGIGFLAYGPLAGGILTGKYRTEPHLPKSDPRRFFYQHYAGDAFKRAEKVVTQCRALAEARNTTPGAVSLAWITHHPAVSAALPGAKTPDQARANASAGDLDIPALREQLFDKLPA